MDTVYIPAKMSQSKKEYLQSRKILRKEGGITSKKDEPSIRKKKKKERNYKVIRLEKKREKKR